MFYTADEPHGLPFDPFKAIIAPRPIGWIGSIDAEGRVNLAPYSFFNAINSRPNLIAFSSDGLKHSVRNAQATGEFTYSLATLPLARQMNMSSAKLADGDNEFDYAELTMAPSRLVRPPFVGESPAALECKLVQIIELSDVDGRATGNYLTIGQVVATHIKDDYLRDGRFDAVKAQTIARCGYNDYATVAEQWELTRPG
ncbi:MULTISPECIES: flavin reductase family protein [Rhodomicrobium]|uniref:flavin reductase family protein n=1 Tax=Rhodomicrobium TaxID=1068 RepID=UPI001AEC8B6E|nr:MULTISPECIES: flavin reductase family protein [Rhodomicrobium]